MTLNLYEIDHGLVKDWVIHNSEKEALELLEDFMASQVCEQVIFDHCKVSVVDPEHMTMTKKGLMSVKQIIDHYNQPYYVKAG